MYATLTRARTEQTELAGPLATATKPPREDLVPLHLRPRVARMPKSAPVAQKATDIRGCGVGRLATVARSELTRSAPSSR